MIRCKEKKISTPGDAAVLKNPPISGDWDVVSHLSYPSLLSSSVVSNYKNLELLSSWILQNPGVFLVFSVPKSF